MRDMYMTEQDFLPKEMPYQLFKVTWKTLQKVLGKEDAQKVFAKLGREIGKLFPTNQVTDAASLATAVKKFLEKGFGMMTKVDITGDGKTITFHNVGCYFCGPNTELRNEGGVPTCLFPSIVLEILQETRSVAPNLKFKNLKFNESHKPGPVGECVMKFNLA
ncbi:MAG: hypothetical protein RBG13Loki_4188 [Promethearchaeota archaeon CR_4]|nr:MAG: hypothetical protein RBG13Loki_4188 [Candidatus Lokiarchaeota archaeon CR_4]